MFTGRREPKVSGCSEGGEVEGESRTVSSILTLD